MKTKTKDKKKIGRRILKIMLIVLLIIAILMGIAAVVNVIGVKSNKNFASEVGKTEYESQLVPELDEQNGYYTFTTDRNFKIMQLTDVHIGGGFMSIKKDNMAINAVAAMVKEEKPDLVIVTGDIAYPVPFQAGTFNNKSGAEIFAGLMETLGVYWAPVYGNHDTEAYSYYNREEISELYSNKDKYPHCLFQSGDKDIYGWGNYVINVKNTKGEITQSLYMFDSNAYLKDGIIGGMTWDYDCVHKDQIEWYEKSLAKITEQNGGVQPKSMAFFHIAPKEMRDAYYEYRDNGYKDTEDIKYIYGKMGEKGKVIYSSEKNYGLVDSFIENGSTQGVFFGHDHLNSMSILYKGIRLTYGYSVDYLAYSGISKYGSQRGCSIINVSPDGHFDCYLENYYQDKYQTVNPKEDVTMDDMYTPEERGVE